MDAYELGEASHLAAKTQTQRMFVIDDSEGDERLDVMRLARRSDDLDTALEMLSTFSPRSKIVARVRCSNALRRKPLKAASRSRTEPPFVS